MSAAAAPCGVHRALSLQLGLAGLQLDCFLPGRSATVLASQQSPLTARRHAALPPLLQLQVMLRVELVYL